MTAMNDGILKADRRGRLRYSPEQREALVKACEASGLSTPRFAALHGVKYQTLAAWLHRRKRASSSGPPRLPQPAPLLLVRAELEAPASNATGPMEIVLPGGARLAVTAPDHIHLAAALIRELSRPC